MRTNRIGRNDGRRASRYVQLMAIALWTTSGCAFMDSSLDLSYEAQRSSRAGGGRTVELARVLDSRPDKNRIGIKKNGYGWETANVTLDNYGGNVPRWVYNALRKELKAVGLDVLKSSETDGGDPRVMVKLDQFFVEPMIKMTAIEPHAMVRLTLRVELSDGRAFERTFKAHAVSQEMILLDGDQEKVLELACQGLFRRVGAAITDLLNREDG